MSLLVEVKSRLLLPDLGVPEEFGESISPEEARDQLLARLFEYSKFRRAAETLRELGEENQVCLMRRPAGKSRRHLPSLEEAAGTGDVLKLKERLVKLIENRREPDTAHVAKIRVDLQRQIHIVRRVLSRHGRFSFDRIFGGEEPLVQAVSLFALLDLLARGEIRVRQAEIFGDILVQTTPAQKPATA
jgi:segregation and condensation protein A